mmetsp:Transcript_110952/g.238996  ORF Transcript_110952/g.238996 Transcript_110952/m.238996 type:complete len:225 (+) Transcript_110952:130-804(+)
MFSDLATLPLSLPIGVSSCADVHSLSGDSCRSGSANLPIGWWPRFIASSRRLLRFTLGLPAGEENGEKSVPSPSRSAPSSPSLTPLSLMPLAPSLSSPLSMAFRAPGLFLRVSARWPVALSPNFARSSRERPKPFDLFSAVPGLICRTSSISASSGRQKDWPRTSAVHPPCIFSSPSSSSSLLSRPAQVEYFGGSRFGGSRLRRLPEPFFTSGVALSSSSDDPP